MPPEKQVYTPRIDRKTWADELRAVRSELLETVAVMTALIERLDPQPHLAPPRIKPVWERRKHGN